MVSSSTCVCVRFTRVCSPPFSQVSSGTFAAGGRSSSFRGSSKASSRMRISLGDAWTEPWIRASLPTLLLGFFFDDDPTRGSRIIRIIGSSYYDENYSTIDRYNVRCVTALDSKTFQRFLFRVLLHKDPTSDRTTAEQWLVLLVTKVQEPGSNPHSRNLTFSPRILNEQKAVPYSDLYTSSGTMTMTCPRQIIQQAD